jgi:NAD-dependent dihydropyrimidine dehydrogenase PreA subunit
MTEEKKQTKTHRRDDPEQPSTLPGIRRFQFFSNLKDRANTKNLNRAAMLGIGTTFVLTIFKPILHGNPQTVYCYECRACYATQDKCAVGIAYQAELVVAARVADYGRFLKSGGLKCVRCGNCTSFCVQHLDLPIIFSRMQQMTIAAMHKGRILRKDLENAYREGLINRQFIDEVAAHLGYKKKA